MKVSVVIIILKIVTVPAQCCYSHPSEKQNINTIVNSHQKNVSSNIGKDLNNTKFKTIIPQNKNVDKFLDQLDRRNEKELIKNSYLSFVKDKNIYNYKNYSLNEKNSFGSRKNDSTNNYSPKIKYVNARKSNYLSDGTKYVNNNSKTNIRFLKSYFINFRNSNNLNIGNDFDKMYGIDVPKDDNDNNGTLIFNSVTSDDDVVDFQENKGYEYVDAKTLLNYNVSNENYTYSNSTPNGIKLKYKNSYIAPENVFIKKNIYNNSNNTFQDFMRNNGLNYKSNRSYTIHSKTSHDDEHESNYIPNNTISKYRKIYKNNFSVSKTIKIATVSELNENSNENFNIKINYHSISNFSKYSDRYNKYHSTISVSFKRNNINSQVLNDFSNIYDRNGSFSTVLLKINNNYNRNNYSFSLIKKKNYLDGNKNNFTFKNYNDNKINLVFNELKAKNRFNNYDNPNISRSNNEKGNEHRKNVSISIFKIINNKTNQNQHKKYIVTIKLEKAQKNNSLSSNDNHHRYNNKNKNVSITHINVNYDKDILDNNNSEVLKKLQNNNKSNYKDSLTLYDDGINNTKYFNNSMDKLNNNKPKTNFIPFKLKNKHKHNENNYGSNSNSNSNIIFNDGDNNVGGKNYLISDNLEVNKNKRNYSLSFILDNKMKEYYMNINNTSHRYKNILISDNSQNSDRNNRVFNKISHYRNKNTKFSNIKSNYQEGVTSNNINDNKIKSKYWVSDLIKSDDTNHYKFSTIYMDNWSKNTNNQNNHIDSNDRKSNENNKNYHKTNAIPDFILKNNFSPFKIDISGNYSKIFSNFQINNTKNNEDGDKYSMSNDLENSYKNKTKYSVSFSLDNDDNNTDSSRSLKNEISNGSHKSISMPDYMKSDYENNLLSKNINMHSNNTTKTFSSIKINYDEDNGNDYAISIKQKNKIKIKYSDANLRNYNNIINNNSSSIFKVNRRNFSNTQTNYSTNQSFTNHFLDGDNYVKNKTLIFDNLKTKFKNDKVAPHNLKNKGNDGYAYSNYNIYYDNDKVLDSYLTSTVKVEKNQNKNGNLVPIKSRLGKIDYNYFSSKNWNSKNETICLVSDYLTCSGTNDPKIVFNDKDNNDSGNEQENSRSEDNLYKNLNYNDDGYIQNRDILNYPNDNININYDVSLNDELKKDKLSSNSQGNVIHFNRLKSYFLSSKNKIKIKGNKNFESPNKFKEFWYNYDYINPNFEYY